MRRVLIAISALLVSTACGSSSDGGTTGPTNTGRSMSAKIDGATFTTTIAGAGVTNGLAILSGSDGTTTLAMSFAASAGTQSVGAGTIVSGQLTAGGLAWKAGPGT